MAVYNPDVVQQLTLEKFANDPLLNSVYVQDVTGESIVSSESGTVVFPYELSTGNYGAVTNTRNGSAITNNTNKLQSAADSKTLSQKVVFYDIDSKDELRWEYMAGSVENRIAERVYQDMKKALIADIYAFCVTSTPSGGTPSLLQGSTTVKVSTTAVDSAINLWFEGFARTSDFDKPGVFTRGAIINHLAQEDRVKLANNNNHTNFSLTPALNLHDVAYFTDRAIPTRTVSTKTVYDLIVMLPGAIKFVLKPDAKAWGAEGFKPDTTTKQVRFPFEYAITYDRSIADVVPIGRIQSQDPAEA